MSTLSKSLTTEEIKQIAQKDDFHIAPFRPDGETFGTPTWVWVVAVDDQLFVRAYNGVRSRWYQAAVSQKAGKIEAAGMVKKVRFEPVTGSIQDEIDEAYRQKYKGSPYLNAMIRDQAKAATLRILPGA